MFIDRTNFRLSTRHRLSGLACGLTAAAALLVGTPAAFAAETDSQSITSVTTADAQISVRGLPAVAKGTVFAEILIDQPIKQIRMVVPGQINRIERTAPYGLMSDHAGKLNPWDTTKVADGDYVLTVTATLANGRETVAQFPFKVQNEQAPAPIVQPAPAPDAQISVRGLPAVAKGTVFAEVLIDQPIKQIRMVVPGQINRIERTAPYGLMSDHGGKLNPWDTTKAADGDYVLTVTATLANGQEVVLQHPFTIQNTEPAPVEDPVVTPEPQEPEIPEVTPAPAPDAKISVSGLPAVVQGEVFAQIMIDQPIEQLHMVVPGHINRIEKTAPYGLMSDHLGKLNPWDTTTVPNGDYVLTVTATLVDGREVVAQHAFKIENAQPTPEPEPTPEPAPTPEPEPTPAPEEPEAQEPEPAPAPSAKITVRGLPAVASGDVFAEILVDQPIQKVRMVVPGHIDMTERTAPFGLMSDHAGKLNAWDTTQVPDGDYVLTVTATLRDGQDVVSRHPFTVKNTIVAPTPEPMPEPTPEPTPEPAPQPEEPESQEPEAQEPEAQEPEVQDPTPAPEVTLEVSVSGLPKIATGVVYAQVQVNQPAQQVRMVVPGLIDRIESFAPFSLMGDDGPSKLNPWNTASVPNGNYTMYITTTLATGKVVSTTYAFAVANDVSVPEAGGGTDPAPAPPVGAVNLVAGKGFSGATPQPSTVGSRTTKTMARWDVVPEQTFNGAFEVGVVAFHSYGMDRVEMSFNGGPWQSITEPSLNPRTKVQEYWATINAKDVADGRVEVRAVAYPQSGMPRVLPTLVLFANAGGTVKFPVIELDAGGHVIPDGLNLPKEGWLTIRPKPGVKKEDCILYNFGRHNDGGHIKIEGLTIKSGPSNRGPGKWGWLWMDDVNYIGVDATTGGELTWWMSDHQWDRKFFTEMNIRQLQTAFHTCPDGIIRNVSLDAIYEDVVRQAGLIVNVTVEDLAAANSSFHPDVFQWYGQNPTNMIVYNFTAKKVAGQGLFPGDLTDCAFVNLNLNVVGQYRPLQMQGKTNNVLIQDSKIVGELNGTLRYDKGFAPQDLVFRDSTIGRSSPYLPDGWQHSQIKVYPQLPTYD